MANVQDLKSFLCSSLSYNELVCIERGKYEASSEAHKDLTEKYVDLWIVENARIVEENLWELCDKISEDGAYAIQVEEIVTRVRQGDYDKINRLLQERRYIEGDLDAELLDRYKVFLVFEELGLNNGLKHLEVSC